MNELYCDEFQCTLSDTCYYSKCRAFGDSDQCYYENFCIVCKKSRTCKKDLFQKIGERKYENREHSKMSGISRKK